jgi:hypothetical protein
MTGLENPELRRLFGPKKDKERERGRSNRMMEIIIQNL